MTTQTSTTPIKVYMIGNNPIDVSDIYQKLKDYASDSFHTEYGFDLKKAFKHILKSRPSCVLIDDNIGHPIMQKFMAKLSTHKDTQDIPVAVLKNSNYRESGAVLATDYILKEGLSADSLRKLIFRTIRFKKMHLMFIKSYRKGKRRIHTIIGR
ncbi:hypothetical protein [Fulvivirga sedimenti]|uniref:Uncharacterized protein n=1 Tax=Fulvivirga sedimenti TaxID=2879465 RepID=A0A9X1HUZ9_9BACT|nr:hypothetical protein [Fulvivirga sedimenti]MCA6078396.1 hypothetical protein [Fulvivirga sedimenti]